MKQILSKTAELVILSSWTNIRQQYWYLQYMEEIYSTYTSTLLARGTRRRVFQLIDYTLI